jgi:hypothetical protein
MGAVSEGYNDVPGATHHVLEPLEALADCGVLAMQYVIDRKPEEQLTAGVAKVIHEVCRLNPWPVGPGEFTVTGTLKDWDVMDRLGEINCADPAGWWPL